METELRPLATDCPQVISMITSIDQLMNSLYPPSSNQLLALDEMNNDGVSFIGAWRGKQLLGCGAIRRCDNDGVYAELKRIYVNPEARGMGIARKIIGALESHASNWRISTVRLEAGTRQPEALALYESLGYRVRDRFGQYPDDPFSVFMEKTL